MEATIVFDTYANVKRLRSVGFTEEQAEMQTRIISELVDNRLATKRDLEELRLATKRDLEDLKNELTIRLGGMLVVGILIITTLVKLL